DLAPFLCQRDACPNAGSAEAAKVCYDHCISVTFASDSPPPLYLCIECANEIHREHPDQRFFDILHPMQPLSVLCENKNCRSTDKSVYSICFSTECASYNGNHPIRYCHQCHGNRHNSRRGADHVHHTRLPQASNMEIELQGTLQDAIISLLKEAKPINMECPDSMWTAETGAIPRTEVPDPISVEDRQLLGRYGVWLMVGLCTPVPDTPDEMLQRLISGLFRWFHTTSYSYTGELADQVEKLKSMHVCRWLAALSGRHRRAAVACLSPQLCAANRLRRLHKRLCRLYCLIPYGVITQEIWDSIMPEWMDAICSHVNEKDLDLFKNIIKKIMEPDGAMAGVQENHMYDFVANKLTKEPSPHTAMPALIWLQTLSYLTVKIPLKELFEMFSQCVVTMPDKIVKPPPVEKVPRTNGSSGSPADRERLDEDMQPETLTCCILMLDILLKQVGI
ncbi:hypothetical protein JYU34_004868, partial [Plutella xylostella]